MGPNDQNNDNDFSFPIPLSPVAPMPMNQQLSMPGIYSGMNTQPSSAQSYNFSTPQYRSGGHTSLGHIAEHLRQQGEDEDEILAYINPEEAHELHERFGSDINPHTGLPQFGLFKKLKKFIKPVRSILPIAGALAGNYFAPGLGGVLGGGLGGALGGKKALKGALTGAAIGGIQGYGLPLLGKFAKNRGMPHLGRGLTQLGQSKLLSGAESLGQGLGLVAPAVASKAMQGKGSKRAIPTPWDSSPIHKAISSYGQQGNGQGGLGDILGSLISSGNGGDQSGGMGNWLNYLLLGLAGAGMVGGKTKYGLSEAQQKEPSLQEIMKSIRIPESSQGSSQAIAPYVPPREHMKTPQVSEGRYEYPVFAKGGVVETPNEKRKRERIELINKQNAMVLATPAKLRLGKPYKPIVTPKTSAIVPPKPVISTVPVNKAPVSPKIVAPTPVVAPKPVPVQELPPKPAPSPAIAHKPNVSPVAPPGPLPKASAVPIPSPKPTPTPAPVKTEYENILEPLRLLIEHGKQIAEGKVPVISPVQPSAPIVEAPKAAPVPTPNQQPSQPIPAYVPPAQHLQIPNVSEKDYQYPKFDDTVPYSQENDYQYPTFDDSNQNSQENDYQYPTFKSGGYIDGESGGQDDDVRVDLPINGYVIDATTVSSIGDGNTKAGVKRLDELFGRHIKMPKKFAKGKDVKPEIKGTIPALVSPGEYFATPQEVTALGKGNNKLGAKKMKTMVEKIRKHKGFKGLPPKARPLTSYVKI